MYLGITGKTAEIIVGDEGKDDPQEAGSREMETHTLPCLSGCLGTTRRTTWSQMARHCPRSQLEPREIEDAKMQDNERLDVDVGESKETEDHVQGASNARR